MSKNRAFTIVELLVVIVVIGVLAAITVVSYTGLSEKAIKASLQSDLNGASRQLKIYEVDNGQYPVANDCTATPVANSICLKSSADNEFSDYSAGLGYFYVISKNGDICYEITNDTIPTLNPNCAPSSPASFTYGGASPSQSADIIIDFDDNIMPTYLFREGGTPWAAPDGNEIAYRTIAGAGRVVTFDNPHDSNTIRNQQGWISIGQLVPGTTYLVTVSAMAEGTGLTYYIDDGMYLQDDDSGWDTWSNGFNAITFTTGVWRTFTSTMTYNGSGTQEVYLGYEFAGSVGVGDKFNVDWTTLEAL